MKRNELQKFTIYCTLLQYHKSNIKDYTK